MNGNFDFKEILLTTNQLPEGRMAMLFIAKYAEKVRTDVHREMADQIFDQTEQVELDELLK